MINERRPLVVIVAGPNGAGKTTASQQLLQGELRVNHFVNADAIARGLSAFDPDSVALDAGRIMIQRMEKLGATRADFALETTLASKSNAPLSDRYVPQDIDPI
jgi:predicted ABC-type ATPase